MSNQIKLELNYSVADAISASKKAVKQIEKDVETLSKLKVRGPLDDAARQAEHYAEQLQTSEKILKDKLTKHKLTIPDSVRQDVEFIIKAQHELFDITDKTSKKYQKLSDAIAEAQARLNGARDSGADKYEIGTRVRNEKGRIISKAERELEGNKGAIADLVENARQFDLYNREAAAQAKELGLQWPNIADSTNKASTEAKKTASGINDAAEKSAKLADELKDVDSNAKSVTKTLSNGTGASGTAKSNKMSERLAEELEELRKAEQTLKEYSTDASTFDTQGKNVAELQRELDRLAKAYQLIRKEGIPEGQEEAFQRIRDKIIEITSLLSEYVSTVKRTFVASNKDSDIELALHQGLGSMNFAELTRHKDELKSLYKAIEDAKIPPEREEEFQRLALAIAETDIALKKFKADMDAQAKEAVNPKKPIEFTYGGLDANVKDLGVTELKEHIGQLKAKIEELKNTEASSEAEQQQLIDLMNQYEDAVIRATAQLNILRRAKTEAFKGEGTDKFAEITQREMVTDPQSLSDYINNVIVAQTRVDELKQKQADVLSGKEVVTDDVWKQYTQDLASAENELDVAKQRMQSYANELKGVKQEMSPDEGAKRFTFISNLANEAIKSGSALTRLSSIIKLVGQEAVAAGQMSEAALAAATSGISLIITAVTSLGTVLSNIISSIKSAVQSAGQFIMNTIKKIIDMVKTLATMIKTTLSKALQKMGKDSSKAFSTTNLRRTLQMLTKYIFGVRSFFFLYRKLRKLVGEGIENLVQFESATNETNHAITELRTSLLYIKNAWAAAFAPIINVVYPILVRFMDMLAAVGNAIARFVAALTGQATVLQAVRVSAGDYADSLAQAGGSAKKAADEQEKLNNKLAAFDDLNVLGLDDDDDPNKGGGGGGGGADDLLDPNRMFERIETPINRIADLVREAWETGDGFNLGMVIAQELGKSFDNATAWLRGEGHDKLQGIANLIGTTLDGMLNLLNLGEKFGTLIGTAVSEGLQFIDTIITPERMAKIGMQIAGAMNTAIPLIVPQLGKTLGNLFSSAISGFWGWVTTSDFANWGKSFADGFNNFLEQMSQEVVITNFGKDVLGGKRTATVNYTGLNAWEMLGVNITEFVKGMIDALAEAIANADWHALGEGLGQLFAHIDWKAILSSLEGLWDSIKKGFEGFWQGFSKNTMGGTGGSILQPIVSAISVISQHLPTFVQGMANFVKDIPWDQILAWVSELPDKLDRLLTVIEGIAQALEPVGELIQRTLGDAGEEIDSFFDKTDRLSDRVSSVSNVVSATVGATAGTVAESILPGSGLFVSNATSDLTNWVIRGVDAVTDMSNSIVNGYNEESSVLNDILEVFTPGRRGGGKFGNIGQAFEELQENLKETGNVANRIKGDLTFEDVTNNLQSMVNTSKGYLEEIPDKFTEMKGAADTQSAGIKSTYNSTFENVKGESISTAQVVQDNFLLASENIKDSFLTSWEEIKKAMSEGGDMYVALSDGVGNTIKALLNGMIAGINVSITKPLQDISKSFNILRTLDVNGTRPFAGIPYLNVPTIPALAQGAVIPPNNKFLAVLGDQTSGTNIEAPLDTIQQAVGAELAPYLQELIAINRQVIQAINNKPVISKNDIGKANAQYISQQKIIKGTML